MTRVSRKTGKKILVEFIYNPYTVRSTGPLPINFGFKLWKVDTLKKTRSVNTEIGEIM